MKIISLTSIPSRFNHLRKTLESLVGQGCANEIRLYIPRHYKRFPNWDGTLPLIPKGVNIIRTSEDLGPATKVLPCAMEFNNEDVQILFCDDDCTHAKNWAFNLFEIQSRHSGEAVATYGRRIDAELPHIRTIDSRLSAEAQHTNKNIRYRLERLLQKTLGYQALNRPINKSGYVDLLFGVGGVVIKPNFFDESALNIPSEAFYVDDVWISAQLAKNRIPIYCPSRLPMPIPSQASEIEALYDFEVSGNRFLQNKRAAEWCRDNLGIWK